MRVQYNDIWLLTSSHWTSHLPSWTFKYDNWHCQTCWRGANPPTWIFTCDSQSYLVLENAVYFPERSYKHDIRTWNILMGMPRCFLIRSCDMILDLKMRVARVTMRSGRFARDSEDMAYCPSSMGHVPIYSGTLPLHKGWGAVTTESRATLI